MPDFKDFALTYPLWILVDQSSIIKTGPGKAKFAEKIKFVVLSDATQEQSFPVFTDQDLAFRFVKKSRLKDEIISIENEQKFLEILYQVRSDASHVVFDPKKVGWTRFVWSIDYVIKVLEERLGIG